MLTASNAALVDQPGEVRCVTVTGVGREPFGPDAEPLLDSLEHPARAAGHFPSIRSTPETVENRLA